MDRTDRVDGPRQHLPAGDDPWHVAADFVGSLADVLRLSGWSFGVHDGVRIRTYNRGFSPRVSASYAVIEVDADLPGPATLRTGVDQYFANRAEAHRLYPDAARIDHGPVHHASATLLLRPARVPSGIAYLALHFATDQDFDSQQRHRLRRVVATVEDRLDAAVGGSGPGGFGRGAR